MVIFGKPKRTTDFVCVGTELAKQLHLLGFQPIYRYFGEIYFVKNDEVVKVVEKWNLNTK